MTTPFDEVIEQIKRRGFHNHRLLEHSDAVSLGILKDLRERCDVLAADFDSGKVRHWLNKPAPGARGRQIDLLIGEPRPDGSPDPAGLRIGIENKSVITAHRNRDARFDDLNESLQVLHRVKPEAVLVATVIIGVADRVLNVPDRITPFYKNFAKRIRPRLSKGDGKLWAEFSQAISKNKPDDPKKPSRSSASSSSGRQGTRTRSVTTTCYWCRRSWTTLIPRIFLVQILLGSTLMRRIGRCWSKSARRTG